MEDLAINRKQFLSGIEFKYTGHMHTLKLHSLFYDARYDQVTDDKAKEAHDLISISDTDFSIYKKGFGKIIIEFKECQVKELSKQNV
jgi:hypothetical protein